MNHVGQIISFRDYTNNSFIEAIFLHKKSGSSVTDQLENLVKSQASDYLTVRSASSTNLPPSTAIPFYERLPNLPTLIVSDFDTNFTNKYTFVFMLLYSKTFSVGIIIVTRIFQI